MKKIFVVSMLSILMISGFSTESFAVAAGACVPSGYKDNGECYPCPSNYNNRSIYKNSIEECCIDELTYDANSGMCVSVSAPVSIVDENTTCTVDGIGVDSGTANMEAIWTPNTIHIDWYNQDTKILSNDCTYDGDITLPSNPANRAGYTFGGWRIRSTVSGNAPAVNNIKVCASITDKTECNASANCTYVKMADSDYTWCTDISSTGGIGCHNFTSSTECRMNWNGTDRRCVWLDNECIYSLPQGGGSN